MVIFKKKLVFFLLLFISFSKSFGMQKMLGKEVPDSQVKFLKPWDDKAVTKGSLIAYQSGQRFFYASLYQKENERDYTIIVKKTSNGNVQSTHGKIVTSDVLRIFEQ